MASRPSVLFVCIHNAGRSQMAAGFLRDLAGDAVEVRSAGSDPGPRDAIIAPDGTVGMLQQEPPLTEGKTVQENVEYGLKIKKVPIDEIKTRVQALVVELLPSDAAAPSGS